MVAGITIPLEGTISDSVPAEWAASEPACCGWEMRPPGRCHIQGMCRRAVDHTVYSWLLSHRPYLQTATWLLDSWLGPAITVSSFLRLDIPLIRLLFLSPFRKFTFHSTPFFFFFFCLRVHLPSFYICSTLLPFVTPPANEIKRWVSREKDKKLVSNNRAGFVSHVYLFCQKLSNTFQDGLALIIIFFFFFFFFQMFLFSLLQKIGSENGVSEILFVTSIQNPDPLCRLVIPIA